MVPKQFVEETIKELIAKKTQAIILITAGFKETGEDGAEAEKRILQIIRDSNARLVGPNCMGIINAIPSIKMNATFVAEEPKTGTMAFCSQSGAIGAAVLNSLRETDIRFGQFISVGNKADVNENDLLEYWQDCKDVNVITYYLESFVDGEKFSKYFIDDRITKPVIVLKGGRTSSGIKAASSHTGALGSSDKVVDAILTQFGIIRADDLNDMFNTAKGFEEFPTPKGNRVAVVTNAGGPAILTVDTLEKNNLALAELSYESKTKRALFRRPEDPAVVINNLLKFQNKKSNTGRIKLDETIKDFKLNEKFGRFLNPNEVTELCNYYKLPIVKDEVHSIEELNKKEIHFPVVLKAVGDKIIHKTDLKGVVLNIKTKSELMKTAEEMIWNFSSKNIQLDKFLIQPFLKIKYELLVGAFRDPSFGPIIMFGSGGKYVEYLDDTVMRSAYLTEYDIDEMINSTKIGKIIQGVRGEESVDMKVVKSAIKNLAQMIVSHKEITEVDLNPLLVTSENKILAVDVRIKC